MTYTNLPRSTKVLPATTIEAWILELEKCLSTYKDTGMPLYKHSAAQRASSWICFPICCSPCIVWSIMWRLLLCPFMCFASGPAYICSNNQCTNGTDLCIMGYAMDVTGVKQVPAKPNDHQSPMLTIDQKARVAAVLEELDAIFAVRQFDRKHYRLAEAMLGVTPVYARECIGTMRKALISSGDD